MTTAPETGLASTGRHQFHSAPVIETAGLRRTPGSPRPIFDHDIWDLTGLADAPVTMGTFRKILDFSAIMNPLWRQVAREYLMARLAPLHPDVATLPLAFRLPMNPATLWNELKRLTVWFNHLTAAGVTRLDQVRQRHCDQYLAAASRSATDPDRQLSPATTASMVRSPKVLALYSELLADQYAPGFIPWSTHSSDTVAGYARGGENRVPPVSDVLLWPLLAGCLYLVNVIAPPLAEEAARARASDQRDAASRRGLPSREIESLRSAIEKHREAGVPAQRLPTSAVNRRLQQGWEPNDHLLRLSWHPFVVENAGAMGHRRNLESLRPELERWVRQCGLEHPWCRKAVLVPRHDDGEPVPWTSPMGRQQLDATIYAVSSAAYFLTSALSGMRASELAELASGCRQQETGPAGVTRYRVNSRRFKGETFGGKEDSWIVIEEVHRAIAAAEAITGLPPGEPLFAKASNNSATRIRALRSFVNGEHGQRLGLEQLAQGPINPERCAGPSRWRSLNARTDSWPRNCTLNTSASPPPRGTPHAPADTKHSDYFKGKRTPRAWEQAAAR